MEEKPKEPPPEWTTQVLICVNGPDWKEFQKIARRMLPAREGMAGRRGAASAMIRYLVRNVIETLK